MKVRVCFVGKVRELRAYLKGQRETLAMLAVFGR